MRTAALLIPAAAFSLALFGCSDPEGTPIERPAVDGYQRALPDSRILVSMPVGGDRAIGELAESYVLAARTTSDINGFIGGVLGTVDAITDLTPSFSNDENEFVWGPWDDGGLDPNSTILYVRHDVDADVYTWAIAKRPKTSTDEDDWTPIIAGEGSESADGTSAEGFFVVDFDASAALDPTNEERGKFVSTYSIDGDEVAAVAGFEAFAERTTDIPFDAYYDYGQDGAGAGFMDFAATTDLDEDGSQEETLVVRTRWTAEGAGRGDTAAFDGDLGDFVYFASECWGTDFNVTFEEANIGTQPAGDAASCVFAEAQWSDDAPEES